VKGVVDAAIDKFGPLCDVVVAKTMVAQTDDSRLGYYSLVVASVMGIAEFPEGVTTFVSIVVCDTVWCS